MFGINVGQIIKGHINEITNQEDDLYKSRIKICQSCPLFTETAVGPVCDSKKCYDPKTEKTTTYPTQGSICGCGCRLGAALRIKNKTCNMNKWSTGI